MTPLAFDTTLEEARERILQVYGTRLVRIIFFGSRVRERARESSDYDLLVVLLDPVDWVEEESRLAAELSDVRPHADVHVYGEMEFAEERGVPGTIAFPAAQHGTVLIGTLREGTLDRNR